MPQALPQVGRMSASLELGAAAYPLRKTFVVSRMQVILRRNKGNIDTLRGPALCVMATPETDTESGRGRMLEAIVESRSSRPSTQNRIAGAELQR